MFCSVQIIPTSVFAPAASTASLSGTVSMAFSAAGSLEADFNSVTTAVGGDFGFDYVVTTGVGEFMAPGGMENH